MKEISSARFGNRLCDKKGYFPLEGHIALTYRCNLNCIHCYCKGSGDKDKELTTEEWKKIIDEIQKEGCLYLTITGGEPLVRDDFLELYFYMKQKGFIINLFTNGQRLTEKIIDGLSKSPPYSIDITLNGITQETYESITQVPGSFLKVMKTIKKIAEKRIKLILKTNCLKQNKHEIAKIKRWADDFLGKPAYNKHYFVYDTMIYPRLNRDKTPCQYGLSLKELLEVKKQDPDMWREHLKGLHYDPPDFKRDKSFLYQCNNWFNLFFINPYGRLKFCEFSDKFSTDLKTAPFKEGFYKIFPQLLKERFKTNSKCRDCRLRPICYYCPARAYLDAGDEEAPVPYYCELAKATLNEKKRYGPNEPNGHNGQ